MPEWKNLDKLAPGAERRIKPCLEALLRAHKENILSIFLWGAFLEPDCDRGHEGINSAVVFRELGFAQLEESVPLVRQGIKKGLNAPLFLCAGHMKSSADSFPLEFLQMRDTRVVLYGEDMLAGVEIKREHLRVEAEEQIKGKLIHLRQEFLEMGPNIKGMSMLLTGSLRTLLPVFRGIIKVKEFSGEPPRDEAQIMIMLCEKFSLREDVFLRVWRHTRAEEKIPKKEIGVCFSLYLGELQKLAGSVDAL